ncbi:glycosyl hydrolase, partial [Flavobacteriaceae bacterium]|nr:glycosyl hydrolase [Flavobacteriaceae bacterium]
HLVVGVTGHLYSTNKYRGVYLSRDGGNTWKQTLFVNDETGIIDMSIAPEDFSIQYAAAWQKDRKAWDFTGNGSNSGIYKSTDAGESWELISTQTSGFPTGDGVGRIGLAVYNQNTLFAIHDSQFRRPDEANEKKEGLSKEEFKTMSKEDFLALEDKKLDAFLKENNFQEKYRAANLKNSVKAGAVMPKDLATYLEDANTLLFDTPVVGAEVYKSTDGGKTWGKTHEGFLDDLYYSYGYYFGHVHVHPKNQEKIYIYGVPILASNDGGKTFAAIGKSNVHADHHALWINPDVEGHLINGNDGGVNITYDDGAHWMKNNSTAVGQFYAINVDNEKPYNVYGGLQDNGVWKGAHNAVDNERWHSTGHNPWTSIMGGDGMKIQIDERNSNIVYTGFQFGNYYRLNLETNGRKAIQPKHSLGESPYRFNWQTPILLSSHNQDILYYGGNKLHRSLNQGDDWETISSDLTQGGRKGNVAYGTLTTLSESPFQFGYIYTGSDDGYVHRTTNGGGSWERISNSFPEDLWVSRVVASAHKKDRVYVSLNGYRWDDFTPYVYMSDDGGKNWEAIASNLPLSPVNVIREDPKDENILYLGNDLGVFVSTNMGKKWEAFSKGLTTAAVHDLVIQSEENHLLVGTHGRSIYKTDISILHKKKKAKLTVFPLKEIKKSNRWGSAGSQWRSVYTPNVELIIYSHKDSSYKVKVQNAKGVVVHQTTGQLEGGYNYIDYDLSMQETYLKAYQKKHKNNPIKPAKNGEYYLPKGTYTIEISTPDEKESTSLTIK